MDEEDDDNTKYLSLVCVAKQWKHTHTHAYIEKQWNFKLERQEDES